jgi:hypothetical protein
MLYDEPVATLDFARRVNDSDGRVVRRPDEAGRAYRLFHNDPQYG